MKAVQNYFHNSAVDLRDRFYRRFPQAPSTRWDLTSIKDRWYKRLRQQGRVILPKRRQSNCVPA